MFLNQELRLGKFSIKYFEILLIFLVLVFAFGIRAHNFKYETVFGFDSYWHGRLISYIMEDGWLPDNDPLAFYAQGGTPFPQAGPSYVFWFIGALMFKLMFFFSAYSPEKMLLVMKIAPALFGSLVILVMYFLVRTLVNKESAFIVSFLLAASPAYAYRTMGGFFEEDSLGFLWYALGLLFLALSIKGLTEKGRMERREWVNAILAGVSFGVMAWTWKLFYFIDMTVLPFILGGFIFLVILSLKNRVEKNLSLYLVLASVVFVGIVGLKLFFNLKIPGNFILILLFLFALTAGALFLYTLYLTFKNKLNIAKGFLMIGVIAMVVFSVIAFTGLKTEIFKEPVRLAQNYVEEISGKKETKIPDRGEVLSLSVGEEKKGKAFFGRKFNYQTIFSWLSLILLFVYTFYFYRKHFVLGEEVNKKDVFILLFVVVFVVAWYMALTKLKFTYVYGFGLGFAAIAFLYFFFRFKEVFFKDVFWKYVFAVVVMFVVFTSVGCAALYMEKNPPTLESLSQWKEAISWIEENVGEDEALFNWWDQGHWITFFTNRKVSADNTNSKFEADQDYAKFLLGEDLEKSYSLVKEKYGASYVLLGSDLFGKLDTLRLYAANSIKHEIVKKEYPKEYFSFIPLTVNCSFNVKGEKNTFYNCGGVILSVGEYSSLTDKWNNKQIKETEVRSGTAVYKLPLVFYKDVGTRIKILSFNANQTTLAKLWFESEESNKYFEKIFENNRVKIFRVK